MWKTFIHLWKRKIVETVDNSFSSTNFDILFVEKLVEKLVENFFCFFYFFFHNLEYHNDDLYEQGVIKLNVDIIWNNALKDIKEELSSLAFSTWFQDVTLKEIKDDTAIIIVPMSIHKRNLYDNYRNLIQESLNKITGTNFELEFYLENEIDNDDEHQPRENEENFPKQKIKFKLKLFI